MGPGLLSPPSRTGAGRRVAAVSAATLLCGLGCGTAELFDGNRMPVVHVEVTVTSRCARPPDTDGGDSQDTGFVDPCDGPPEWESVCFPHSVVRDEGSEIKYESQADLSELDGLLWISRMGEVTEGSALEVSREDGQSIVGIARVRIAHGPPTILYDIDAEGGIDIVAEDLLLGDFGDLVMFAYADGPRDVTEIHQVVSVEERRVEPYQRKIWEYCCATGPAPEAAGFGVAIALLAARRRRADGERPR